MRFIDSAGLVRVAVAAVLLSGCSSTAPLRILNSSRDPVPSVQVHITRGQLQAEPFVTPRVDGDQAYTVTGLAPGASEERRYQQLGEFSLDIVIERSTGARERYLVGYSEGGPLAIDVHDDFVRFEEDSILGFATDAWPVSAPPPVLVREIDSTTSQIDADIRRGEELKVARVKLGEPRNADVLIYRPQYADARKALVTYADGSTDTLYFSEPVLPATTNDVRHLIRRVQAQQQRPSQIVDYWRDNFVRADPPMDEVAERVVRAETQQLVQAIFAMPRTFTPVR
jgi:hypothetical protein